MMTIGAFARLGGVSIRAVRHYDDIGLLRPVSIDPSSGYRYYQARQLSRLHRIQALQDLGLSLQQIGPLLDGELGVEQLQGMLALTRAQLSERVAEDQARLARVEQRLRYLELEDDMSLDLVIKTIPPVRVAQIRYRGDEGLDWSHIQDFTRAAAQTLRAGLESAAVRAEGPMFVHYEERADATLTPIVAVPIGDQLLSQLDTLEVAVLPAITAVVTVARVLVTEPPHQPGQPEVDKSGHRHGVR